jgi:hypothetical protein
LHGQLGADDLDRLFSPLNYLGSADTFIDRVLAEKTGFSARH